MRKVPNDQEEIIELIKEKKYNKVWGKVKYIGLNQIADITKRRLIFSRAVRNFNPYENNNFILFFKNYLRRSNDGLGNDSFKITTNNKIIKDLKNEAISPTEGGVKTFIENLKTFIKQ